MCMCVHVCACVRMCVNAVFVNACAMLQCIYVVAACVCVCSTTYSMCTEAIIKQVHSSACHSARMLLHVCPKARRIEAPLLREELLLSYPTGEKKSCCLLPLCKLASDEGFLGESQRGFVIGLLRRMEEVRRGYGEKTGTKFPSLYPDPSCYIFSLFILHPSLPHTHDPVINVVEISGSLINTCPILFPNHPFF